MSYDGFYTELSTRASVNEILNQALRAKEEIRELSEETFAALNGATNTAISVESNVRIMESNVRRMESNVGQAVGRAELSANAANDYAGQSLANAVQSQEALVQTQAIKDSIGDTDAKFKDIDDKFDYYDIRIAPIQQTDTSAMDEDVAVVGGGIQAEFKDKIRQPPVGIVAAYAARTLVAPKVNWDAGWTTGISNAVIIEKDSKRINKVVVNYAQMNALNEGGAALLGYEFSLGGINPNGNFAASSDFFSPNLESVPNKHRVQRMAGYTNQDTGKVIQNYGPYIDKTFRELAPSDHPGYVAGRYYTNPFWYVEDFNIPANTAFLMPIHIKARVHIDSFRVFTGAGAGGQYRVAVYSAVQGLVAERILVSSLVNSPGANAQIDINMDKQLDPGMYWFAVACSVGGTTFKIHKVYDKGYKGIALHGHANPTAATKETQTESFAVIPLPSLAAMDTDPKTAPVLTNAPGGPEPHIFFKVKAIPLPSYPGNGRPTNN